MPKINGSYKASVNDGSGKSTGLEKKNSFLPCFSIKVFDVTLAKQIYK